VADYVASVLIPAGLDGYIVDPESDKAGDNNDWNQTSLAPIAKEFCSTIRTAAQGKPFLFGTTSGCIYPSPQEKPNIPWSEFFGASDALYPQCYWRMTVEKHGKDVPLVLYVRDWPGDAGNPYSSLLLILGLIIYIGQ
jgi:hypothetical protein